MTCRDCHDTGYQTYQEDRDHTGPIPRMVTIIDWCWCPAGDAARRNAPTAAQVEDAQIARKRAEDDAVYGDTRCLERRDAVNTQYQENNT